MTRAPSEEYVDSSGVEYDGELFCLTPSGKIRAQGNTSFGTIEM